MEPRPLLGSDRKLVIIGAGNLGIMKAVREHQQAGDKVIVVPDREAPHWDEEKTEELRLDLIKQGLMIDDIPLNGMPEEEYPDQITMTKEESRGIEQVFSGDSTRPAIEQFPFMLQYSKASMIGMGASHIPVVRDTPKIGRNESCPCESGKKYKKCCGQKTKP